MVVLPDQPFPVSGGSLTFDFIRPDGDGPYPLVVFLHGGGWISGDKSMYRDEAVWLSQKGFACACPSYRLAPLYPFPTPVADAQAFLKYVRDNAESLQIDPRNITVVGNSAGGHLALLLGLCPTDFGGGGTAELADKVVSICGISDLCMPAAPGFMISQSFIEQFMDCSFDGNEGKWKEASPMSYVAHATGQFLLIHGTDDDVVPIDQSRTMYKSLTDRGVRSRLVELEGEMHSFTYPGWERIRNEYLAFLGA